jgi:hypothetical protein
MLLAPEVVKDEAPVWLGRLKIREACGFRLPTVILRRSFFCMSDSTSTSVPLNTVSRTLLKYTIFFVLTQDKERMHTKHDNRRKECFLELFIYIINFIEYAISLNRDGSNCDHVASKKIDKWVLLQEYWNIPGAFGEDTFTLNP